VADAVCGKLEGQEVRCWIAPRDILPGIEYGEAIIRAIEDCRVVVLIFSSHANDSGHVRREVERAVSKGRILVPFRIEEIQPNRAMEFALGNTHWLEALTPPLEQHIRRLGKVLRRLLDTPEPVFDVVSIDEAARTPPAEKDPGAALRFGESPVIKFTNYLISRASKEGTRRVHLAGSKSRVSAKTGQTLVFEIDVPAQMVPSVIGRVKVMAGLSIDRGGQYQQGRFEAVIGGKKREISVMVIPGQDGEDCWVQFDD